VKIVILDGRTLYPDRAAWSGLDPFGEVVYHDVSTADQVPERAAGTEILLTNKSPIREATIDRLPDLRFISVLATSFDCVDVAAARRRSIPVSNVPVYGTASVAQYTFALLLELCHHVAVHDQAVRAGEWSSQPDFSLRKTALVELAGKSMGLAGYGRIGHRVAELARAFGMRVLAYDPIARGHAGG
jgi:glycerate dehydrogenase